MLSSNKDFLIIPPVSSSSSSLTTPPSLPITKISQSTSPSLLHHQLTKSSAHHHIIASPISTPPPLIPAPTFLYRHTPLLLNDPYYRDQAPQQQKAQLEMKFTCPKCGLNFIYAKALKLHLLDCTLENQIKCPFCPAVLKNRHLLVNHVETHRPGH